MARRRVELHPLGNARAFQDLVLVLMSEGKSLRQLLGVAPALSLAPLDPELPRRAARPAGDQDHARQRAHAALSRGRGADRERRRASRPESRRVRRCAARAGRDRCACARAGRWRACSCERACGRAGGARGRAAPARAVRRRGRGHRPRRGHRADRVVPARGAVGAGLLRQARGQAPLAAHRARCRARAPGSSSCRARWRRRGWCRRACASASSTFCAISSPT